MWEWTWSICAWHTNLSLHFNLFCLFSKQLLAEAKKYPPVILSEPSFHNLISTRLCVLCVCAAVEEQRGEVSKCLFNQEVVISFEYCHLQKKKKKNQFIPRLVHSDPTWTPYQWKWPIFFPNSKLIYFYWNKVDLQQKLYFKVLF